MLLICLVIQANKTHKWLRCFIFRHGLLRNLRETKANPKVLQWQLCVMHFKHGWGGGCKGNNGVREKRSLSEFIKYQGNIAGAGSASRTGALVPLITTDMKPGLREGGKEGGGCSATHSASDYSMWPTQLEPEVLKVTHTTVLAAEFT